MLDHTSITQIEEDFELTDFQRMQLEKNIDQSFKKIRKERFRDIARTLRNIDGRVMNSQADSFAYALQELSREYRIGRRYFKALAIQLDGQISPQQFSAFLRNSMKNSDHNLDLAVHEAEFSSRDLTRKYEEFMQYLLGNITIAQRRAILDFNRITPFPWMENAKNEIFILQQYARSHESKGKAKKFVAKYFNDYDQLCLKSYLSQRRQYERKLQKFLYGFWYTLTTKQIGFIQKLLIDRASQLERFAKSEP